MYKNTFLPQCEVKDVFFLKVTPVRIDVHQTLPGCNIANPLQLLGLLLALQHQPPVNLGLECKMRTLSGVLEPAAFWSVVCKELNWRREQKSREARCECIHTCHNKWAWLWLFEAAGQAQNCDVWSRGGGIDRKIFNFEGLQIAEVSQKNLNLINAAVYALDGLVDDGGRKKNIFLLCKIIRKSISVLSFKNHSFFKNRNNLIVNSNKKMWYLWWYESKTRKSGFSQRLVP